MKWFDWVFLVAVCLFIAIAYAIQYHHYSFNNQESETNTLRESWLVDDICEDMVEYPHEWFLSADRCYWVRRESQLMLDWNAAKCECFIIGPVRYQLAKSNARRLYECLENVKRHHIMKEFARSKEKSGTQD